MNDIPTLRHDHVRGGSRNPCWGIVGLVVSTTNGTQTGRRASPSRVGTFGIHYDGSEGQTRGCKKCRLGGMEPTSKVGGPVGEETGWEDITRGSHRWSGRTSED